MKTKLAYVLTCSPEATYIEQALMAIFSARHWNPDAHITLLTDDQTSSLIHDKNSNRSEILNYISEEIITTFPPDRNMMYRSRWIKTKVRDLISGDFLFIDCDTICCRPLSEIDHFNCEVGAVLESHLPIADLNLQLQTEIERKANLVGWSIRNETQYFSSGVIYVKDTANAHRLYKHWHDTWLQGVERGINIDQPTLAKANIDCGHIIQLIPDSYNCILFTEPQNTDRAHILHIAAFRNPSRLFEAPTLSRIKNEGLSDPQIKKMILNPCSSFRPFDFDILHSNIFQRLKWISDISLLEGSFSSACLWMLRKRIHLLRKRNSIKDNTCRK